MVLGATLVVCLEPGKGLILGDFPGRGARKGPGSIFAVRVDCNKHGGGSPRGLSGLKISGLDLDAGFILGLD